MERDTKLCIKCNNSYKICDFPKDGKNHLGEQKYSNKCKCCLDEYRKKQKSLKNSTPTTNVIVVDPYLSNGITKLCNKCNCVKPNSDFSILNKNKDKLNKTCKECIRLYMEDYRINIIYTKVSEKKCLKCNHIKDIEEFSKNNTSKDGHNTYCKKCTSDMQNTILNDNPDLSGDSVCLRCNETKPKTQFYLKRTRKEGIHQWCKKCVDESMNSTKNREQNKLYRKQLKQQIKDSTKPILTEKKCTNCNITKSVENFYIVDHNRDGYSYGCKECVLSQKQQYINNNRLKFTTYWKQYRQDNVENRIQRWNVSIQEKKCTNCQQIKPANDFVKHYWNSDGLSSSCFSCRQNYNKKWQQQNPNYGKQYYINNKEICDLKWKEYYKINKEKIILNQLKYRDLYREVERERRIKKRMLDIKTRIDKGLGEGDSIVYFIKFINNTQDEVFFKIGVTNRTVQERFKQPHYKDYTYEILLEKYYDNNDAYIVESLLIKQHREIGLQYIPNNKFPGYTECFVELEWDFINSIP